MVSVLPLKPQSSWLLILMALLLGCSLLSLWTPLVGMDWGARFAFLALCALGRQFFTVRETVLFGVALIAALIAWRLEGMDVVLAALDLATFFGAFIAALTVMRDVAARSTSVLAVGSFLTKQPAGRRYFSTAIGGHLLAVFLNFGAVSLMSPLIQNSVKDADGNIDKALERRQLNALIRGFAWVLLWAPTMLAQAILLTIFPEVSWRDVLPLGLVSAAGFILLGRLYDRYEWRGGLPASTQTAPVFPKRAFWIVALICALLIVLTLLVSGLFDRSIAQGLMIIAPVVTLLWYLGQRGDKPPSVLHLLAPSAAALARSAVALGLSGFIGRALGRSLPTDSISQFVDLTLIPGWLFLAILPVIINLGGQVALSPILIVVLLGEVMRGFEVLPAADAQIVFALSVGWSLSMMTAPNATATLLISSVCRIPPTTLTWRWNLRFGLLCYVMAVGIFFVIT